MGVGFVVGGVGTSYWKVKGQCSDVMYDRHIVQCITCILCFTS